MYQLHIIRRNTIIAFGVQRVKSKDPAGVQHVANRHPKYLAVINFWLLSWEWNLHENNYKKNNMIYGAFLKSTNNCYPNICNKKPWNAQFLLATCNISIDWTNTRICDCTAHCHSHTTVMTKNMLTKYYTAKTLKHRLSFCKTSHLQICYHTRH